MRRLRIPLWILMSAILLVAVAFAALRHPTELVASGVFTLAVGLLGFAVVGAAGTRGRKRLAWVSFATFGGLYAALSFGPFFSPTAVRPPPLLATTLMTTGLQRLDLELSPPGQSSLQTQAGSFFIPQSTDITYSIMTNISPGSPLVLGSGLTPVVNREPFYQVGHSLALLLFGFIAAVVTLIVTAFRRDEARS